MEALEAQLGEQEAALEEAVAAAQELLEYEADEDETITAALMKQELGAALKEWKGAARRAGARRAAAPRERAGRHQDRRGGDPDAASAR